MAMLRCSSSHSQRSKLLLSFSLLILFLSSYCLQSTDAVSTELRSQEHRKLSRHSHSHSRSHSHKSTAGHAVTAAKAATTTATTAAATTTTPLVELNGDEDPLQQPVSLRDAFLTEKMWKMMHEKYTTGMRFQRVISDDGIDFTLGRCNNQSSAYLYNNTNEFMRMQNVCSTFIQTRNDSDCKVSCANLVRSFENLLIKDANLRACVTGDPAVVTTLSAFIGSKCARGFSVKRIAVPLNYDLYPPEKKPFGDSVDPDVNDNYYRENPDPNHRSLISLPKFKGQGLGDIIPSAGRLIPPFTSHLSQYVVNVINRITEASITPLYSDGTIVTVNGELAINQKPSVSLKLKPGINEFKVIEMRYPRNDTLKAETRAFTITFVRQDAEYVDPCFAIYPCRKPSAPVCLPTQKTCKKLPCSYACLPYSPNASLIVNSTIPVTYVNLNQSHAQYCLSDAGPLQPIRQSCGSFLNNPDLRVVEELTYLHQNCSEPCLGALQKFKTLIDNSPYATRCMELRPVAAELEKLSRTACDLEKLEITDFHFNITLPGISFKSVKLPNLNDSDGQVPKTDIDKYQDTRFGEPSVDVAVIPEMDLSNLRLDNTTTTNNADTNKTTNATTLPATNGTNTTVNILTKPKGVPAPPYNESEPGLMMGVKDAKLPPPVDKDGYCTGDPNKLVLDEKGQIIYCKAKPAGVEVDQFGKPITQAGQPDGESPYPKGPEFGPDGSPIYPEPPSTATGANNNKNDKSSTASAIPRPPALSLSDDSETVNSVIDGELDFYISTDDYVQFEKLFAHKLTSLEEAGYTDRDRNLRALIKFRGDLNKVFLFYDPHSKNIALDDDEVSLDRFIPTATGTASSTGGNVVVVDTSTGTASTPPSPMSSTATFKTFVNIYDEGFGG